jgi:hypothetical protein
MPSNWIFNANYADAQLSQLRDEFPFETQIEIKSKRRNLNIRGNDPFLLMNDGGENHNFSFSHYGTVIDIGKGVELPYSKLEQIENEIRKSNNQTPLQRTYSYKVIGATKGELVSNNRISDLSFSLTAIDLYTKPYRHFQKQLRSVESEDYETIVKGYVYVARTAFGKIANAMPPANRMEFTLLSMEKFQNEYLKEIDYMKALEFLFDYIDRKIIEPGRYLVNSDLLLQKVFKNTAVPFERIGFLESEEKEPDSIHEQAKLFKDLFGQGKGADLLADIKEEIYNNGDIEKRFTKIFNKSKWPVDVAP